VLFLVTLAPAFLLLMLSYVFSFDVGHTRLAVLDWDKSMTSRNYLSQITADGDFTIQAYFNDYTSADALLLSGDAGIALIIPHGFGDDVRAGRQTQLQALVDGMNPITARQGMAQLNARTRMFAVTQLGQAGAVIQIVQQAEVHGRAWYNPPLKSLNGMVPGLLAIVLFMPAMAVTLALAREKETGSFEGLIATPVRGMEYLAGKLLAYALAGMLGTIISFLVAVYWFQVPFRGDITLLLVCTGLYFFATMSTGMLIVKFVASQQTAMIVFLLAFFMPSFFTTGLISPLDSGSLVSQLTSNLIPPTHFITIARAIFLKGLGWEGLWQPALALTVIGGLAFAASLALFKKKIT
jgi:ABC-type multidrug transport system permease subunit